MFQLIRSLLQNPKTQKHCQLCQYKTSKKNQTENIDCLNFVSSCFNCLPDHFNRNRVFANFVSWLSNRNNAAFWKQLIIAPAKVEDTLLNRRKGNKHKPRISTDYDATRGRYCRNLPTQFFGIDWLSLLEKFKVFCFEGLRPLVVGWRWVVLCFRVIRNKSRISWKISVSRWTGYMQVYCYFNFR